MKFENFSMDYFRLHASESWGSDRSLGLQIYISGTSLFPSDRDNKELYHAYYEAERLISEAITKIQISRDSKAQESAKVEKEELLSLFSHPIFVEEVPNGYCSRACCSHLPWFIVTTPFGRVKIGWRKRVINIDWTETVNKLSGDELFPGEKVTKSDKYSKERYIHAWSLEDAKRYLDVILK